MGTGKKILQHRDVNRLVEKFMYSPLHTVCFSFITILSCEMAVMA